MPQHSLQMLWQTRGVRTSFRWARVVDRRLAAPTTFAADVTAPGGAGYPPCAMEKHRRECAEMKHILADKAFSRKLYFLFYSVGTRKNKLLTESHDATPILADGGPAQDNSFSSMWTFDIFLPERGVSVDATPIGRWPFKTISYQNVDFSYFLTRTWSFVDATPSALWGRGAPSTQGNRFVANTRWIQVLVGQGVFNKRGVFLQLCSFGAAENTLARAHRARSVTDASKAFQASL